MAIYYVTKSFYERRSETYKVDTSDMSDSELREFIDLDPRFEVDEKAGDASLEDILLSHEVMQAEGGMADEPMIEYEIERV